MTSSSTARPVSGEPSTHANRSREIAPDVRLARLRLELERELSHGHTVGR